MGKNKSQRGISPRNSAAKFRISRRNFAAEHGEKIYLSLRIKNQLTGVSRCFAVFRGEKDDLICLYQINFIYFQVV